MNLYIDLYIQVWYYETIKREYKLNIVMGICTRGVFPTLDFTADFPPAAPGFYQRAHSHTPQKSGHNWQKSSYKIKHKKIPRVHDKIRRKHHEK